MVALTAYSDLDSQPRELATPQSSPTLKDLLERHQRQAKVLMEYNDELQIMMKELKNLWHPGDRQPMGFELGPDSYEIVDDDLPDCGDDSEVISCEELRYEVCEEALLDAGVDNAADGGRELKSDVVALTAYSDFDSWPRMQRHSSTATAASSTMTPSTADTDKQPVYRGDAHGVEGAQRDLLDEFEDSWVDPSGEQPQDDVELPAARTPNVASARKLWHLVEIGIWIFMFIGMVLTRGGATSLTGTHTGPDVPTELNTVEEDVELAAAQFNSKGWRRLDLTVDSGAGRSVMNPDDVPEYPLYPSEGSRRGQECLGAGSERMPNLGEKKIALMTGDGVGRLSTFQGVRVRKPLLAVSASCDKEQSCFFDNDGSFILDRNSPEGREIRRLAKQARAKICLERKNGVYVLPTWVVPPEKVNKADRARLKGSHSADRMDTSGDVVMNASSFPRRGQPSL